MPGPSSRESILPGRKNFSCQVYHGGYISCVLEQQLLLPQPAIPPGGEGAIKARPTGMVARVNID